MDIGGRIRTARKRAGLSQEEVARRAGMSLKGMAYIERGHIEDPHYSSLAGIADALGMSVGELVGEEPTVAGKAPAPAGEEYASGQGEERALRYLRTIADNGDGLEERAIFFLERAGGDPPWSRFISAYEHYAGIVGYVKALADRGVLPSPDDGPLPAAEESVVSDILAISRRLHEVADALTVFSDRAELELRRDNREGWREERERERERRQELVRAGAAAWARVG